MIRQGAVSRESDRSCDREWCQHQEEYGSPLSNGSHIVVKGNGHDIQIDKPEAVVDAISQSSWKLGAS